MCINAPRRNLWFCKGKDIARASKQESNPGGASWEDVTVCDTRSCGRDETRLCGPCLKRVSRQLELLPALYVECEHMLVARPKREVERVRGGLPGSATINEAAVSARSAILSTLASLAGLVRDERPVEVVLRREVTPLAAFLRAHLDWLAEHPAARELCDELEDAVDMAQRVVHPEVGRKLEVGTCENHGCSSTVYATFRAENGHSPTLVSCDGGHVVGPRQWLLLHHAAQAARRGVDDARNGYVEQVAS